MNNALKKAHEAKRRKHAEGVGLNPILSPIDKAKQHPRSLRAAINAKCFDCVCFQKAEVKRCGVPKCPLYQLRPWQGGSDE